MTEAIWIAVIVAVPTVLVSAVVPIVMKVIDNRESRRNREEDKVLAKGLVDSTKAVAVKVDEAAGLLVESNAKVEKAAEETKGQLFAIHTLVNSDKTKGVQRELDAARMGLTLMHEVARLNRAAGQEPGEDAEASIAAGRKTISDLEEQLRERALATAAVEKQQENAKT